MEKWKYVDRHHTTTPQYPKDRTRRNS
ncbi:unnamed protein product [Tuber melanosporum]|uniref:(Perigord truffle) hypothetical protein n=1 Tax=Tuber melanosporum (strain Mel28) TaxID=656061 RepID=D5G4M3_TUBMM|nr:unnamed protein product [Tuber melanosporum]